MAPRRMTTCQCTRTSISQNGTSLVNIARCASEEILRIFMSVLTRRFGVDGREQNM